MADIDINIDIGNHDIQVDPSIAVDDVLVFDRFEALFAARRLSFTNQRRVIARILIESRDHPNIDEIYFRAKGVDKTMSIATVYRTMGLFVEFGLAEKIDFGDGKGRYEMLREDGRHDHIIDIESGRVIEFCDPELDCIIASVCQRFGVRNISHTLKIYCKTDLLPSKDQGDR